MYHEYSFDVLSLSVDTLLGLVLLLYKQFYSKQYNHPIDKIEVEYFIVKRKLWENAMFPQKRVQKFSPASGTVSMNKVAKRLNTFLDLAFDEDGGFKTYYNSFDGSKIKLDKDLIERIFKNTILDILREK